jgi:hypothetical protein
MTRESNRWTNQTDTSVEHFAARVAAPLQGAERADSTLASRVMTAVRQGADSDTAGRDATSWWRRPVTVRVTPIGALALAASIAAMALTGSSLLSSRPGTATSRQVAATADTVHVVRFVFVAPGASSVAVVGDFNRWDAGANRLRQTNAGGVWSESITLAPGRHEYAFVVDGTKWVADPTAAVAFVDEFGGESSVVTVGGTTYSRGG